MSNFRVTSSGLNLRSFGEVTPDNIIAVLPQGQIVTRLGSETDSEKWWRVQTVVGENTLEGFVSKSYLSPLIELTEKVLWVVGYDDLDWFVDKAVKVKATAVAIRTSNDDLEQAISIFHSKAIKVYGWRWPLAQKKDSKATRKLGTQEEAARVVALIDKGLDGYYVDPECDNPADSNCWDKNGLETLAEEFCETITGKLAGKPFGTTSHFRGKATFGKLPWKTFFKFSNVFLPQAYWKASFGIIGSGKPDENYRRSLDMWETTGAPRDKIVPMAGELEFSTPAQIKEYAQEAQKQGVASLHFYTATKNVKSEVWDALAKLG
ncbi:SH3 type 3 domain-containing protein (plasmid) [Nostoc sp. NIES-2111]|nr:SH3 type 3 domain-containing protein [Nostoc sp. NIES-2111]